MNLSLNSRTARLYRWFYNQNEMPENLCPYFWKSVFMWVVLIPYSIYTFPMFIINYFRKETQSFKENIKEVGVIYLLTFFVVSMIAAITRIWIVPEKALFLQALQGVGFALWNIIGILVLCFTITVISDKISKKKQKNKYAKKEPSIIIEFAKAKYHQYCPTLKWDEN